jgi:hypothetical protein
MILDILQLFYSLNNFYFMHTHGYIPAADSALVDWAANFVTKLTAHAQDWNVTEAELTALNEAKTLFANLHQLVDSPAKSKILVDQKNEARKQLVTLIRDLVGFKLKNPIITNNQRLELGLPVHDNTRTPVPTPTTHVVFTLKVQSIREVRIDFKDEHSDSKAKPYGYDGAVVFHEVMEQKPNDPNTLTHSVLATKTPFTLEFNEEQRGKKVFVAIKWQNEKGQMGPWSEVQSIIVP